MEHLRPHRGHRDRVRGAAGRDPAGPDRPAAAGLGPCGGGLRRPAGRLGRGGRTHHRRGGSGPLPGPGEGRARSTRPCRPSAGNAPTAAGTWCWPTRSAWCSWAGPTNRSSSPAGAWSWGRSTRPCPRCRGWPPRPPPCSPRPAATRSSPATWCRRPAGSSTWPRPAPGWPSSCQRSWSRRWGSSTGFRSRPPARWTARPCRGRFREARATRRAAESSTARPPGWPGTGRTCWDRCR